MAPAIIKVEFKAGSSYVIDPSDTVLNRGVDVQKSVKKYEKMLTRELQKRLPKAEIVVTVGGDLTEKTITATFAAPVTAEHKADIEGKIDVLASRVWEDWCFKGLTYAK